MSFSSTSLVQITVVSIANLHKRPEALARYYVASYWQAVWVKKLRWKTIELPSFPHPPVSYLIHSGGKQSIIVFLFLLIFGQHNNLNKGIHLLLVPAMNHYLRDFLIYT